MSTDDGGYDLEAFEEDERLQALEARTRLQERCEKADLRMVIHGDIDNEDGSVSIWLPCGRDYREIYLHNSRDVMSIVSVPFEKYRFVPGYEAIWCPDTGFIEACLQLTDTYARPSGILEQLLLYGPTGRRKFQDIELVSDEQGGPQISIGSPSILLQIMCEVRRPQLGYMLKAVNVRTSNGAIDILRRTSDSVLFQIEQLAGIALLIARQGRERSDGRRFKSLSAISSDLAYPKFEYDGGPMSLYWYSKIARSMPLLRFLALYQIIEFYFPVYSAAEARRKIGVILKDPTFRIDRDFDLNRIVEAVRFGKRSGIGNERDQLKATIRGCIESVEVLKFIEGSKERETALTSKIEGITSHRISTKSDADLRDNISDRIYDIRCKIVHTKDDGTLESSNFILPFSREEHQIEHDIDLIEFIAQKALINGSISINWKKLNEKD